ncbi:DinB family protein [Paractinoplanes lichenicola]|uniref:DinB family protein n=1 Tax=Paractinoplanes lichenicola TaxID=2802976 RepID=A0ABS1VHR5_9ACTN|nr:DinB family protein [Actinoplanes lichenicola]MBL7254031.1 DinB family protein [Actinoplanes lichenicola]
MRTDMPASWDERGTLTAMLDYARATVRAKCEGLSEDDARRAPLPTSPLTTIAGLVSHVRWVEYSWFDVVFLGQEDRGPWTDDDPDREMRIALDAPLAELLDDYDAQSERYRQLVAETDLDDRSQKTMSTGETVTMRFILLHLIEETARHNGHIDILRELADGVTGT